MELTEGIFILAVVDGPLAGLFYFLWKRFWQ